MGNEIVSIPHKTVKWGLFAQAMTGYSPSEFPKAHSFNSLMTMNLFRTRPLAVLLHWKSFVLIFTMGFIGCASNHYVGYHEVPHRRYGYVSQKTEQAAKNFEIQCIQALLAGNKFELETLMSKKLYEAIGPDSMAIMTDLLKNRNNVSGKFFITNNQLNWKKGLFKKETRQDGFKHYDYIMVRYIIEGYQEAYLYMYMKKIKGFYKLCGLKIQDLEYSELGRRLNLSWLVL